MTNLRHRIPPSARFVARGRIRLPLFVGLLALARAGIAAHDAPAPLPVENFAVVGIETTPARPAVAKWLTHLPAHVQIPNAQLRVVASPVGGRAGATCPKESCESAPGPLSISRATMLPLLSNTMSSLYSALVGLMSRSK